MGGGTPAVPPPSNATEKGPPLAGSPPYPPSPVFLRGRWAGDLGRGCSVSGPQEGEGNWGKGPPFSHALTTLISQGTDIGEAS